MRLPEKTIELNFCAELGRRALSSIFWFGLTQAQEAVAGFDMATRVGGRVCLFQIKASRKILKRSGARQFRAPHDQLSRLQARAVNRRSVFYVLPNFGTTAEVGSLMDPLAHTWLLDVTDLPSPFPHPTIRGGGRTRKSGVHYFDLTPPILTIRSDPVPVDVTSAASLASDRLDANWGVAPPDNAERWSRVAIDKLRAPFTHVAVGALVLTEGGL